MKFVRHKFSKAVSATHKIQAVASDGGDGPCNALLVPLGRVLLVVDGVFRVAPVRSRCEDVLTLRPMLAVCAAAFFHLVDCSAESRHSASVNRSQASRHSRRRELFEALLNVLSCAVCTVLLCTFFCAVYVTWLCTLLLRVSCMGLRCTFVHVFVVACATVTLHAQYRIAIKIPGLKLQVDVRHVRF